MSSGCLMETTGRTPSSFDEKYLTTVIALWYQFVSMLLMTVLHKNEVQKKMAVLLYAIKEDIPINVGKLIASQIQLSIHTSHIALFFPSIISELCAQASVLFRDDEEWLQPMRAISVKDMT